MVKMFLMFAEQRQFSARLQSQDILWLVQFCLTVTAEAELIESFTHILKMGSMSSEREPSLGATTASRRMLQQHPFSHFTRGRRRGTFLQTSPAHGLAFMLCLGWEDLSLIKQQLLTCMFCNRHDTIWYLVVVQHQTALFN